MTLYKYVTFERADVIETERIRYTQPALLNDPFEMKPVFGEIFRRRTFGKMLFGNQTREILAKQCEVVPRQYRWLYKAVFWLVLILGIKQHFTRVKTVNAAMTAQLQRHLPQMLEKFSRTIGVLSLSESSENLLMWSHYAGQHAGFVIAVDEAHPLFNARRSPVDELFHLRKVVYSRAKPKSRLTQMDGVDLLLRKSVDWSYEREWRIIKLLDSPDVQTLANDIYLFSLPAAAIQGIILGAHISDESRERIRAILSEDRYSHAWLKQAEVASEQFRLNFLTLPKLPPNAYPSFSAQLNAPELDQEKAVEVSEIIRTAFVAFASQPLDLSRLKNIQICTDVGGTLAALFKQKDWLDIGETYVLGGAAGEEVDVTLFLKSERLTNWLSMTKEDRDKLIHLLHSQAAHVHNITMRYRALGEKTLTEMKAGTTGYLTPIAFGIWNDYIVARLSASSLPDLEIFSFIHSVLDKHRTCHKAVAESLAAYRHHGNLRQFLREAAGQVQEFLGAIATLMGYVDGKFGDIAEMAIGAAHLNDPNYERIITDLLTALHRMYRYYPEWEDFKIYDDLIYVARSLGFLWGISLRDTGKGFHVTV